MEGNTHVSLSAISNNSHGPKEEEKQKPRAPQENRMEGLAISFSKSKKQKSFSKEELLVVILKRQLAVKVFPRGRNLSPKRKQLVTLKS